MSEITRSPQCVKPIGGFDRTDGPMDMCGAPAVYVAKTAIFTGTTWCEEHVQQDVAEGYASANIVPGRIVWPGGEWVRLADAPPAELPTELFRYATTDPTEQPAASSAPEGAVPTGDDDEELMAWAREQLSGSYSVDAFVVGYMSTTVKDVAEGRTPSQGSARRAYALYRMLDVLADEASAVAR
jgi:hypothetical protein